MKKFIFTMLIIFPIFIAVAIGTGGSGMEATKVEFKISSPAFNNEEFIPQKYACDGSNVSPPIGWSNAPAGTKSFALICDDPDAPAGNWVHWIVYNIPPNVAELKEEASSKRLLPKGAVEGSNDYHRNKYDGPCPPSGIHRYFFKLFALDKELQTGANITKKGLLELMNGHILAQATLIGKYKRK